MMQLATMGQREMFSYSTRLLKGGALVREMRLLLRLWDGTTSTERRIVEENLLSLPSRKRTKDAIQRSFVPRLVQSRPRDLWRTVAVLERAGWSREQLLPIHYYATACAEPVLWDFVVEMLAPAYCRGQLDVSANDAERFLERAPKERFPAGRWSEYATRRMAQGILSALRDFGVLAGAAKKRIAPIYLPTESFAVISAIRWHLGVRGEAALAEPAWQLFYLSEEAVERFFIEADQKKLLVYQAAGSVIRIDYPAASLEDYARSLAQGRDRLA